MSEQLKSDFEGDGGTILVFPGPDPERYPTAYDKETWHRLTNRIVIREGEWVSYCLVWDKNREVDYLQGIKRPWWATGIFYKWWYRRVLKQSIKSSIDYLTQKE